MNSKLCSKLYDVRIIDCYMVMPTMLARAKLGTVHGFDDTEADEPNSRLFKSINERENLAPC